MNGKGDTIYKCIFVKAIFMISMFYCWSYIKVRWYCNYTLKTYFQQCHIRKDAFYASFYNLFLSYSLKYFRS